MKPKPIYTNRKQSERLIAAGVRLDSADVCLNENSDDRFMLNFASEELWKESMKVGKFPAWSTTALLDMLPRGYSEIYHIAIETYNAIDCYKIWGSFCSIDNVEGPDIVEVCVQAIEHFAYDDKEKDLFYRQDYRSKFIEPKKKN